MGNRLIRFISPEDFELLYKAIKPKNVKDKQFRLAVVLGYGAGLRISEITGSKRKDGTEVHALTSNNVDLKTHQIKVISGKGDKDRITVTPSNMNESHLSLLPIKLPMRTLQYKFQQLTKKVLGEVVPFHALRHGFGNYQANILNIPLPMVQAAMGHSRIDTTGIYTKANPKQVIDTMWDRMKG